VKNDVIHGHIQEIPQILPGRATFAMDVYSPTNITALDLWWQLLNSARYVKRMANGPPALQIHNFLLIYQHFYNFFNSSTH
jgi:hypothetical protein